MACCGQKREQLKRAPKTRYATINRQAATQTAARLPPQPQQTVNPTAVHSAVKLRYLASARVRVIGAATGRTYEFSGASPLQSVDARDAEALLRSRFFHREA